MMKLSYLLALVPLAAAAGDNYAISAAAQTIAQTYSHAAHLSPLSASDQDTLRVWTRDYMFGQVQGYVLTETRSTSCLASSRYSDGSIAIGRVTCTPSRKLPAVDEALRALPAFSRSKWDCPASDGYEVYMEGVRQHKYFAVEVSNPQVCDDPESKAIVDLLRKLNG